MTIHAPPPEGGRIIDEPMETALSRRYLAYALSTITNRALPDVRDGFKPVHRRILYAMHQMRLNPQAAARKCAKVVGEVMGGYHPHGDSSIYDALARMTQDWSMSVPLVDGQGNFGSVDGLERHPDIRGLRVDVANLRVEIRPSGATNQSTCRKSSGQYARGQTAVDTTGCASRTLTGRRSRVCLI